MPDVEIRTCRKVDLSRVQLLVNELYQSYSGRGRVKPDISRPFAEFERSPDKGRILVFEHEEQVVGYAIILFFFSNEFGGDVIDIDELLIDSRHRGSGAGSQFFTWLESEYPRCVALTLQVAPYNTGACKLYERRGFRLSGNNHLYKLMNQ